MYGTLNRLLSKLLPVMKLKSQEKRSVTNDSHFYLQGINIYPIKSENTSDISRDSWSKKCTMYITGVLTQNSP